MVNNLVWKPINSRNYVAVPKRPISGKYKLERSDGTHDGQAFTQPYWLVSRQLKGSPSVMGIGRATTIERAKDIAETHYRDQCNKAGFGERLW